MLVVERRPDLRDPVMLVALTGWVDAGFAGAGALAYLTEQMHTARPFARFELADLMDLQQVRPTVRLVDGVSRAIDWPAIQFLAGAAGRDVVVCFGPEPSIRWRSVTEQIVGLARELHVSMAITLGGIPAPVSHRRPIGVLATATRHSVLQEIGEGRPDYTGPTGLQTVLQVALGEADIPAVGLWAQVPHYVGTTASPAAVRALLERVRDVARVTLDLAPLAQQVDEYVALLEQNLSERPDVAEIVRQLDAAQPEQTPDGERLVSEIERFLRDEQ